MGGWFVAVVLIFVLFIMFLAIGGDKVFDKVADRAIPVEVEEEVEDITSDFLDFIKQPWYGDYKLNQLPKSFKIGNVHFDKVLSECDFKGEGGLEFDINILIQSYVTIDSKVYDNGELIRSVNRRVIGGYRRHLSVNTYVREFKNEDLSNYILNNLDKVEEVN